MLTQPASAAAPISAVAILAIAAFIRIRLPDSPSTRSRQDLSRSGNRQYAL
jgi:hypothetical protein